MTKLVLEFDDFHWKVPENCLHEVETLVSEFPTIKISLFTPSMLNNQPLTENRDWVIKVRKLIESNNIELCVHGVYHTQEEFKYVDEGKAIAKLSLAHSMFNYAKLPFVKVFRGPHWGLNIESIQALNKLGYTHLYNHEDYRDIDTHFKGKSVYYNWNLKDEAPDSDIIIAHGHTHNVCGNGIKESLNKIQQFIKANNPDFLFASEV